MTWISWLCLGVFVLIVVSAWVAEAMYLGYDFKYHPIAIWLKTKKFGIKQKGLDKIKIV